MNTSGLRTTRAEQELPHRRMPQVDGPVQPRSDAEAARERVIAAVERAVSDVRGRLVIGCSGGVDSSVLLWAVSRLVSTRVLAAHVNHAAQSQATAWQEQVQRFAESLGVAFVTTTVTLPDGGNFEANARRERHRWLAGLLGPGDVLLLAHHLDDEAETVLLRLLQGRGAYGMPAWRPAGAGELRRPLLDIPAAWIRSVAKLEQLPFVIDPTNLDGGNDRSWLRTRILPMLTGRRADALAMLSLAGRIGASGDAAGRHLAASLPEPLPLASLPVEQDAAAEILRWWLLVRETPVPGRPVIARWMEEIRSTTKAVDYLNLEAGRLVHASGLLYLSREVDRTGFPLDTPEGECPCGTGILRWRDVHPDEGLRIVFDQPAATLRRAGRPLRVRTLLQANVLPWERPGYPLLYAGADLVEVFGLAVADDFQSGRITWAPGPAVYRPGFHGAIRNQRVHQGVATVEMAGKPGQEGCAPA